MADFWERKGQELRARNPQPLPNDIKPVYSQTPWWARDSGLPGVSQVPEQIPQNYTEGTVDGHDVSRASHRKGEGNCPECGRDGFFQPNTGPRRCYFCNYIDGRNMQGLGQLSSVTTEGPTHRARQVSSGGGIVSNFQGNIKTASQAVGRIR